MYLAALPAAISEANRRAGRSLPEVQGDLVASCLVAYYLHRYGFSRVTTQGFTVTTNYSIGNNPPHPDMISNGAADDAGYLMEEIAYIMKSKGKA
jgi:hypothetical protein